MVKVHTPFGPDDPWRTHSDPDLLEDWCMGPPSDLLDPAGKDEDTIVDLMVEWFHTDFEDPAHSTPHNNGAYVFVWGGPYDAREVPSALENVSDEQVDAVVEIIEEDNDEWAPARSRMRTRTAAG
jgi:hypothetical protein